MIEKMQMVYVVSSVSRKDEMLEGLRNTRTSASGRKEESGTCGDGKISQPFPRRRRN